jgi:protein-S-isoprenylcysteine O-methyltransferase Ste14
MEIALWMTLVAIVLVFLIFSKLAMVRALFQTKALQWAKHQKTGQKSEASWVWRTTLLLTVIMGIAEFRKLGNPLLNSAYSNAVIVGLSLLAIGLWVWVSAMAARKQFTWFFQVLNFGEKLPPYSVNGIYATVRNPRELGLLLVLGGLALALSMKFTLVFAVLLLFATCFKASVRDRAMIEKYGKPYIDHMRTSKKLIPYVY